MEEGRRKVVKRPAYLQILQSQRLQGDDIVLKLARSDFFSAYKERDPTLSLFKGIQRPSHIIFFLQFYLSYIPQEGF